MSTFLALEARRLVRPSTPSSSATLYMTAWMPMRRHRKSRTLGHVLDHLRRWCQVACQSPGVACALQAVASALQAVASALSALIILVTYVATAPASADDPWRRLALSAPIIIATHTLLARVINPRCVQGPRGLNPRVIKPRCVQGPRGLNPIQETNLRLEETCPKQMIKRPLSPVPRCLDLMRRILTGSSSALITTCMSWRRMTMSLS